LAGHVAHFLPSYGRLFNVPSPRRSYPSCFFCLPCITEQDRLPAFSIRPAHLLFSLALSPGVVDRPSKFRLFSPLALRQYRGVVGEAWGRRVSISPFFASEPDLLPSHAFLIASFPFPVERTAPSYSRIVVPLAFFLLPSLFLQLTDAPLIPYSPRRPLRPSFPRCPSRCGCF